MAPKRPFLIGWPLLHESSPADVVPAPTAAADALVRLREERDQALEALRDLELDRRTGKIADEDYAVLDAELRARAAAAIEALERRE